MRFDRYTLFAWIMCIVVSALMFVTSGGRNDVVTIGIGFIVLLAIGFVLGKAQNRSRRDDDRSD